MNESGVKDSIEDRDPPEYHLAVLNQKIREMMNLVVRPFGLKLTEWRILQCLRQLNTLTINDLSEMAVIERTVTSRLVDKLVARELVKKTSLPNDRRSIQVVLTKAGARLVDECDEAVTSARGELFAGLSQKNLQAFNATLVQLQQNAATVFRSRSGGGFASTPQPRKTGNR